MNDGTVAAFSAEPEKVVLGWYGGTRWCSPPLARPCERARRERSGASPRGASRRFCSSPSPRARAANARPPPSPSGRPSAKRPPAFGTPAWAPSRTPRWATRASSPSTSIPGPSPTPRPTARSAASSRATACSWPVTAPCASPKTDSAPCPRLPWRSRRGLAAATSSSWARPCSAPTRGCRRRGPSTPRARPSSGCSPGSTAYTSAPRAGMWPSTPRPARRATSGRIRPGPSCLRTGRPTAGGPPR